jgi:hypothetical protein
MLKYLQLRFESEQVLKKVNKSSLKICAAKILMLVTAKDLHQENNRGNESSYIKKKNYIRLSNTWLTVIIRSAVTIAPFK